MNALALPICTDIKYYVLPNQVASQNNKSNENIAFRMSMLGANSRQVAT